MTTPPWKWWDRSRVLISQVRSVTGDLERDTLLAALVAIEHRMGHRRGWDQPARLWTLHLADVDSGAIEARTMPPRTWQSGHHRNPADALMAHAARLPDPPAGAPMVRFADSPDGLAGVAFMAEGFSVPPALLTAEQRTRAADGERVALDHPERTEIRTLTAVDINGRVYHVQRFRDEDPTARTQDTDRGRVPWALGRIAAQFRPTERKES
ncbi:hypothetical protein DQ384_36390 [Sphaerisporangium album]|uniref:Uncharacterized protein n=1 Tax=Sphaerisporangium album TaxID=509200 RepID=A0A367EVA5_9ACTN|nr:hypothetical protein [Sphaerisporangium album]RCG21941.1 hypothetical protein DQ384_36390 [Sphaerisporangium album]